ncbi:MAG TPA: AAA family ATPase [Opitutaceae bacterium]|nr:AAA family ATPase [Opitutaceae bacterium]
MLFTSEVIAGRKIVERGEARDDLVAGEALWLRATVIDSVAFRNFKALRATSLKLAPFNLVVGPNGSGKTSLIQAVLQLRTLAKLPLADPSTPLSGNPEAPEINFNFSPPFDSIEARMGCRSEMVCDLLQVKSPAPAAWGELKQRLGRMRSFVFDSMAMALPAARSSGELLVSNGANLSAVLALRKTRAPADFARFAAEVLRILPEFSGFVFVTLPDDTVDLAMTLADGSGNVPSANLSQGTLYLLAVLALAFDPAPPTVLCIEEIDRGIHPRMLREIRDALYRLSYPASFGEKHEPVQVIATTHSPYFLDLFRDHPEEIVITQKHGNEAHFARLSDRADLPELLSEGSLGDMWFSGILGGVPEEP